MTHRHAAVASLVAVVAAFAFTAAAQIQIPKKIPKIPVDKIPGLSRVPGLDKLLGKEPPVTTSLTDAVTEVPFLDEFEPNFPMSLGHAERNNEGIFSLRPGTYRYEAQSYCLKAGTHGPGRGEGYLYAPLKGPKAEIVRNILRRSIEHSNIPQRDIQVLLWAIIARTKLSDMSRENQLTAARLLTPKELFDLNGGALGLIPEEVKQQAYAKLPESVRKVVEAENRIRQMLTQVNATFADLERVAVLLGEPPVEPGDRTDLPRQRWSYHPDGYFVRFDPHGYSSTSVDVSVPDWHQVVRDDSGRIIRISDRHGRHIEATYVPSARKAEASAARASSFASVRFLNTLGKSADVVAKWDKTGWLLSGVPGEGSVVAGETLNMTDAADRVATSRRRRRDFDKALPAMMKGKRTRGGDTAATGELLDLASFYDAVKAIAGSRAEKDPRLARHLEVILGAWQLEFHRAATTAGSQSREGSGSRRSGDAAGGSAGAGGETSDGFDPDAGFDPSGNVGTPGQTGRQRLGQSSRCGKECGCDRDDLCKDLAAAQKSATGPVVMPDLVNNLKKLKKHFCDNPMGEFQIDGLISSANSRRGPDTVHQIRWALNELMDQSRCMRTPECVVTAASPMICPHGGFISCRPTNPSPVGGGGLLLNSTDPCVITGCPFTMNGVPSPCMTVQWSKYGPLQCGDIGIAIGANGVPQGPVVATGQHR